MAVYSVLRPRTLLSIDDNDEHESASKRGVFSSRRDEDDDLEGKLRERLWW